VVVGGGGGSPVLRRGLFLRGRVELPADPKEKDRVSPGTVVRVTRSPIFRTRTETAGKAGGGFGPGVGDVKSPNIIAAAV
jgi:hypothetical protein